MCSLCLIPPTTAPPPPPTHPPLPQQSGAGDEPGGCCQSTPYDVNVGKGGRTGGGGEGRPQHTSVLQHGLWTARGGSSRHQGGVGDGGRIHRRPRHAHAARRVSDAATVLAQGHQSATALAALPGTCETPKAVHGVGRGQGCGRGGSQGRRRPGRRQLGEALGQGQARPQGLVLDAAVAAMPRRDMQDCIWCYRCCSCCCCRRYCCRCCC
jgi:hypothetical protein